MKPRPQVFRAAIAALLVVASHGAEPRWADPRGFFTDGKVTEQELRPGLRWISAAGRHDGRAVESQMLVVDLRRPDLRLEALVGEHTLHAEAGQLVKRSTISQMTTDRGALGAINVAFFDIGSSQASQGLVIQGGNLLREPQPGRPALLASDDGRLTLADATWEGRVHAGEQRRPLAGMNRPALAGDEVVAYQLPWVRSPGSAAAFTRAQKIREILIGPVTLRRATRAGEKARLSGAVLEIRDDGRPFEIGPGQLVLTASQTAAPFFRRTEVGNELAIDWTLGDVPDWHAVHDAVAAQPLLVRHGRKIPGKGGFWTTRHPRSAIAIHPDRRQAILLVVDGRSLRSAGMSLGSLADYLVHLGADAALNFDGGGSSAITARIDGRVRLLNSPSGVRERPVPTGLGVVEAD